VPRFLISNFWFLISKNQIQKVLNSFLGRQLQIPPMFSAKKIAGQKLYHLAREGKTVERQPNEIEIKKIELLDYQYPDLKIKVACSSGTYIRTLAHDIGQKLGCGAYLGELERTKIGEYLLDRATNLEELNSTNWRDFTFLSS